MEYPELIEKFDSGTLPKSEWTHRAHLRVGLAYIQEYGTVVAMRRLREAIQSLNLVHGVLTTRTNGYHETRTRVWLAVLAHAVTEVGATFEGIVERFSDQDVALVYYRKETLESWEARTGWVAPDLLPLPCDPGEWGPTPPLRSCSP